MSGRLRLIVLDGGYLGTSHAACMANAGFDVFCVATDLAKVGHLKGHEAAADNVGNLPETASAASRYSAARRSTTEGRHCGSG
jgi:hypothetical protein